MHFDSTVEWNTTLYINFMDYEKAFDSLHRESMWKILRHHGIPPKIVALIKMMYKDPKCRVICNNTTTESFKVTTGVKQGCLLSPILFILAMNWVMKETTKDRKRGIRWTLTSVLEDLDYADDVGLLSSCYKDMQEKTTRMKETSELIGLKVNKKKTKVMKINSKKNDPIRIDDHELEDVEEFDYLGSRTTADGDAMRDVKARLSKARHAFASLKTLWQARNISISTKMRIYKSNIISVLLYS